MYNPDFWCVIKINSADPHYRVFASWTGGYTYGSSWRMNSGITKCWSDDEFFYFEGFSGSVYKCHKNMYGCHWESQGALNNYMNQPEVATVDLLPETTNWMEINWSA